MGRERVGGRLSIVPAAREDPAQRFFGNTEPVLRCPVVLLAAAAVNIASSMNQQGARLSLAHRYTGAREVPLFLRLDQRRRLRMFHRVSAVRTNELNVACGKRFA